MDVSSRLKQFIYAGSISFLMTMGFSGSAEADMFPMSSSSSYLTLAANDAFIFNPRTHSWKAVSNGRVIKSGRASGGSNYCRDIGRSCRTPTGTYRVISKQGAGCVSSRYPVGRGGAKMPYCMFFSQYYAIHGAYDVPGYNASHGCIRVRPSDAYWLHRNFIKIGTKVIVQSY